MRALAGRSIPLETAHVRPSVFRILAIATIVGLAPTGGVAQETGVSAKLHPWGLFDPGAWKTVHVVTETFDEQGQRVSLCESDTKTTLVDIDNDGVTLETQACMEVAGKRFLAEPQSVRQGFHGEMLGPNLTLGASTDGEVVIQKRKIPCKVQQLESVVPNGKTVTTIYYSATVAPFVLKRESVTTDSEGKNVLCETTVDVVGFNLPLGVKIRGEPRNGIRTKTVRKSESGTTTTWADILPGVPGGVVGDTSKELDKAGRLVRRTTLVLIDYSTDPEQDQSGLFGRKRPPRHRGKNPPHSVP